LGGGTLTVGSNDSSTAFAGSISGSGGLTKTGTGTLTLTGTNSFSGAMTLENGTLITATLASSGISSPLGSGSQIVLGGSGTTGELSYTGALPATTNRAITLNAGGGSILLSAADLTLGGNIGGSGGLTKIGAGVLVLSGSNNFAGTTTVSTGTLRLAGGAAVGDSSAVTLATTSGTSLDLNGSSETIGSLSGGGANGGNVTLGGGTLTVGSNDSSTAYAGIISGSGGLTKTGTGTFTLTGTNSFSGAMTVENGTLITATLAISGFNSPLGSGSQIVLGGSGTTGELAYTGALTATTNRAITLNGGGGRILLSAGYLTLGGNIGGGGGLTKTGLSVLVLSGSNNWTGPTTLAAGTLRLAGGAAIGDSSAVTLANTVSIVLDLANNNETIGSLAGGGNVTLGAGTLRTPDLGRVSGELKMIPI
jgi:autotransporter-associated beta strand protein